MCVSLALSVVLKQPSQLQLLSKMTADGVMGAGAGASHQEPWHSLCPPLISLSVEQEESNVGGEAQRFDSRAAGGEQATHLAASF